MPALHGILLVSVANQHASPASRLLACSLMVDDARPDGDARAHVCPACRLPVPCGAVVFGGDDWYHLGCPRGS